MIKKYLSGSANNYQEKEEEYIVWTFQMAR